MKPEELSPRLEAYRERQARIANLYEQSRAIESEIGRLQAECTKDNGEFQAHVAETGALVVKATGGGGVYLLRPKAASLYTDPEPEFIPFS